VVVEKWPEDVVTAARDSMTDASCASCGRAFFYCFEKRSPSVILTLSEKVC
jgi:hypothetical protein